MFISLVVLAGGLALITWNCGVVDVDGTRDGALCRFSGFILAVFWVGVGSLLEASTEGEQLGTVITGDGGEVVLYKGYAL